MIEIAITLLVSLLLLDLAVAGDDLVRAAAIVLLVLLLLNAGRE